MEEGREGGREKRGGEKEKKGEEEEQEHKDIWYTLYYLTHLEDRGVREGEVEGEPPELLCREKGEGARSVSSSLRKEAEERVLE